jgi:hypothetical protein
MLHKPAALERPHVIGRQFKPLAAAVVRNNSVTCRPARGNIRDAARQGSVWLGRHTILRGDGANWDPVSRIRRRQRITTSIPDPDIACARMLPRTLTPCWEVYTMSIS